MFIAYVGTPGSGKTYEAVQKITDQLKLGRRVATNIDGMDDPHCRQWIKTYCNITDYQMETLFRFIPKGEEKLFFEDIHPETFCVIDECHKFWNARGWSSKENNQFCTWASEHRHQGHDVILITQDIEKVDKQARSLIEWTYVYRKVNFFGGIVKNSYLCYTYAGDDYRASQALNKATKAYDPNIFRCYKSYVAKDIKEQNLGAGVNILKHPVFYIIPVMLVVFIYMLFGKSSFATGDLFGTSAMLEAPNEEKEPESIFDMSLLDIDESIYIDEPIQKEKIKEEDKPTQSLNIKSIQTTESGIDLPTSVCWESFTLKFEYPDTTIIMDIDDFISQYGNTLYRMQYFYSKSSKILAIYDEQGNVIWPIHRKAMQVAQTNVIDPPKIEHLQEKQVSELKNEHESEQIVFIPYVAPF